MASDVEKLLAEVAEKVGAPKCQDCKWAVRVKPTDIRHEDDRPWWKRILRGKLRHCTCRACHAAMWRCLSPKVIQPDIYWVTLEPALAQPCFRARVADARVREAIDQDGEGASLCGAGGRFFHAKETDHGA